MAPLLRGATRPFNKFHSDFRQKKSIKLGPNECRALLLSLGNATREGAMKRSRDWRLRRYDLDTYREPLYLRLLSSLLSPGEHVYLLFSSLT